MRPREHEPIDPEIAEQLDAIDATLAGDPVAPRFAELAELALLLSVARPEGPRPEFSHELDRRVQARFRRDEPPAGALGAAPAGRRFRGRRSWPQAPMLGLAGSALAAVVVGIAVVSGAGAGGSSTSEPGALAPHAVTTATASHAAKSAAVPAAGGSGGAARQSVSPGVPAPAIARVGAPVLPSAGNSASSATSTAQASSATPAFGPVVPGSAISGNAPQPVPNGRKIVQSSSLQLGAPARRVDAVAQEVFIVVGNAGGIVDSSNVSSTGGPDAGAEFHLRIPSASLQSALTALSRLRYASVIARIDNTRDINSSFVTAQRQIAAAEGALARLRVKLAGATSQTDVLTLKAQIANENAKLAQAQAALGSVNRQVDYSRVDVSIQASAPAPTPVGAGGGGGFGLHQAGHDALRVLDVSAAVALIALAVLVPLALLAALGWWTALAVQRRRRERALDLA